MFIINRVHHLFIICSSWVHQVYDEHMMNTWDHWDASWGSRVRSSRWTRTRLEWVALNKSVHFNKAKFSDKPSCHIKALMRTRSLILNQWLRCGKSNLDLVSLSLVYLQIALAYCMLCSVPSERKHSSSCINEYSDNYCRSSIFSARTRQLL